MKRHRSGSLKATRRLHVACLVAVTLTSAGVPAQAQSRGEFMKAVPDAPAFTFLSVTPGKIERPGSIRDLGVAVLNGVGDDGNPTQGVAVDASLWNLIPGYDISLAKYQQSRLAYLLANLQASVATAMAAGDSTDLNAAIGFKTVIVDQGDPLLSDSLVQAVAAGLARCRDELDQPGMSAQIAECNDSVAVQNIARFTGRRWNAAQLAVAAAFGGRFLNGEVDRPEFAGLDAWLVGSLPVGSRFQVLGQATYKQRTENRLAPSYTAFNAGVRVIGGSSTFNLFGEWGREWRTPDEDAATVIDDNLSGWSAGVELRLAPNVWISTGLGTHFDSLDQPNRTFVIANVKWGLSDQDRLSKIRTQ
jgi:hypothetical protein